jgi:hypothetical protein
MDDNNSSLRFAWVIVLCVWVGGCTAVHAPSDHTRAEALRFMRDYQQAFRDGDAERVREKLDDSTPGRAALADAIADEARASGVFARNAQAAMPEWLGMDVKNQWEGLSRFREVDGVGQDEMWMVEGGGVAVGSGKAARALIVRRGHDWRIRFEPAASEAALLELAREERKMADVTARLAARAKDDPDKAMMGLLTEMVRIRKERSQSRAPAPSVTTKPQQ